MEEEEEVDCMVGGGISSIEEGQAEALLLPLPLGGITGTAGSAVDPENRCKQYVCKAIATPLVAPRPNL